MLRIARVVLALCLLAGLTGFQTAAAQVDDIIDLANVPLPIQELPESGYQVLSGGYLNQSETVSLIATPRNLDHDAVTANLMEAGIARTYVLDLVLPEDRGWEDSPALAVVQTSVYIVAEGGSPEQLVDLLANFSNSKFVEERDPAAPGAMTIAMIGESGDQLRTIVSDGRIVFEIASLDATGQPDATEHALIVEATLARAGQMSDSGAGLSSQALSLQPGGDVANFAHAQQTGVHGLYRYRDGAVQPAIGELATTDYQPARGLDSLYLGSQIARNGSGTSHVSIWLAQFDSSGAASEYFQLILAESPAWETIDPFFSIGAGETWTDQGVLGVYRVSGTFNGQSYSGNVEIRQQGPVVVAIGYRSIGMALPAADVTSSMMDHQLFCLANQQVCPPFDLAAAMPIPGATPVLEDTEVGTSQFGWSVQDLGPEWVITEEFSEQGYDRLSIRNGMSIFELESVVNHHGQLEQCVLDELHLLQELEEHSYIRLWEDSAGNTVGGQTSSQAWIVYQVEPLQDERADQEYVIRIDCFTLMPDTANLVVRQIAPIDFWEEEAPKGEILRDAIVLPESSLPHGKLALSTHDRRTTMIISHWIHRAA